MKRLIKQDEQGRIICSKSSEFYTAAALDCERNCMDCEEMSIRDRLLEYEDEAEQREKGCDFCCNDGSLFFQSANGEEFALKSPECAIVNMDGSLIFDLSSIIDYCPKCGRRLANNDEY